MRYFELLNLRREPFSNSPDPELFYRTRQHQECLQALEIALRLKRGLSVVTGHVGTGKTTLCRQLIRQLGERQGIVTHLILDPAFSTSRELLAHLDALFGGDPGEAAQASDWQLRENIKNALLRLAVEEDRLVVLIVDEGQKISLECLEILRELLNFETNEHKLLQIVIFGQLEFEPILASKANLADRVNLRFRLGSLDFQDTRELIQARLAMCAKDLSPEGLFSFWALLAVYLATDGYPRQIVQLCHQALLAVIIRKKPRVTWGVVRSCMRWRTLGVPRRNRSSRLLAWSLAALVALAVAGFLLPGGGTGIFRLRELVAHGPGVKLPDATAWLASLKSSARPAPSSGVAAQPEAVPTRAEDAGASEQPAGAAASGEGVAAGNSGNRGNLAGGQGGVLAGGNQPLPAQPVPALGQSGQSSVDQLPADQASKDQPQPQPQARQAAGPPRFTGVRHFTQDGSEILEILTDRPVDRFATGFRANPARFVVDLQGSWERGADRELPVGSGHVDKIRTAVNPDKLRVAIYLKDASAGSVQPTVEKTPSGLRVVFK